MPLHVLRVLAPRRPVLARFLTGTAFGRRSPVRRGVPSLEETFVAPIIPDVAAIPPGVGVLASVPSRPEAVFSMFLRGRGKRLLGGRGKRLLRGRGKRLLRGRGKRLLGGAPRLLPRGPSAQDTVPLYAARPFPPVAVRRTRRRLADGGMVARSAP